MQIDRLRLRQLPAARGHRARARRRPHRHHRAQRRREDHAARGDRLGDVRHRRRPAAPGRRSGGAARRRGPRCEVELDFALGAHRYRVVRTLNGAELYQDSDAAPIANSLGAVTEQGHPAPGHDPRRVLQHLLHRAEGARGHGGDEAGRSGPSSSPGCWATSGCGWRRTGCARTAPALRAPLQALEAGLPDPAELEPRRRPPRRGWQAAAAGGRSRPRLRCRAETRGGPRPRRAGRSCSSSGSRSRRSRATSGWPSTR